jgi:predicted Zn-dependent protease with MMP-like domain
VGEALAHTALGDFAAGETALGRAASALGDDDQGVLWARGELCLAEWRFAEARSAFEEYERLERSRPDPNPGVYERLALLADHDADPDASDVLLRRAAELDPEGHPFPPRLGTAEFEAVVAQAAERLPSAFRERLEELAVLIEPVPSPELVGHGDPAEIPPDLLGLFCGPSALEGGSEDPVTGTPARIYLFQRNLERAVATRAELVDEVRVTLYHELGHVLGFEEHELEGLGLD